MGEQRRCLVTGAIRPKADMLRFVVGPDGTVVPDIEGRLPGRGLWVTADREVLAQAVAKNRFKAAMRGHGDGAPEVPADLAERTLKLLRARVLSLIGLARRSGDLLAGFDVLSRAAAKGEGIALLVEASDAAKDGKRKLRALLGTQLVYEGFAKSELSDALGRENVTHLGLKPSRLTEKIRLEMTRLAALETRREAQTFRFEPREATEDEDYE